MTAIDALTRRQKLLVEIIAERGCSITEAAIAAGYAAGESGRAHASKTLRKPHVQAYLRSRLAEAIGLAAPAALRRIIDLTRGARSEYVQLEAAKDLLDRAGYGHDDVIVSGDRNVRVVINLGPPEAHGRVLDQKPLGGRQREAIPRFDGGLDCP
jgi:phage terminase small subunit